MQVSLLSVSFIAKAPLEPHWPANIHNYDWLFVLLASTDWEAVISLSIFNY